MAPKVPLEEDWAFLAKQSVPPNHVQKRFLDALVRLDGSAHCVSGARKELPNTICVHGHERRAVPTAGFHNLLGRNVHDVPRGGRMSGGPRAIAPVQDICHSNARWGAHGEDIELVNTTCIRV